jgi:hypothetical protein
MRHVICHYHIYKNSGTTFDAILSRNFGERHVSFDGPFPYFSIGQKELAKVILRHRSAVAFSSHQISLPVPGSLDFNVLPVVFLRHPILRIRSIYEFKRAEDDGTPTSRHAAEMAFGDWCRHALSHPQELTQVSNAQVRLLSRSGDGSAPGRRGRDGLVYDLYQARRALHNVELLARTERFSRDVSRFPALLERYGIAFEVGDTTPRNVTASRFRRTIEQRLEDVALELGEETMQALLAANRQDLELYAEVGERLDAEPAPVETEPLPEEPEPGDAGVEDVEAEGAAPDQAEADPAEADPAEADPAGTAGMSSADTSAEPSSMSSSSS